MLNEPRVCEACHAKVKKELAEALAVIAGLRKEQKKMENIENGMLAAGPCRYCGDWTSSSDGTCPDCIEDIRIAEVLEAKEEKQCLK
jgi:hypothetical protein